MRASTAYFAGAGTVIAAIVGGIGGGLLIADMISPESPKQEMTKLEQRMSSQPIDVKAEPSEPAPDRAASPSSTTAAAPAGAEPEQPPAQNTAAAPAPEPPPQKVISQPAAASTAEAPASPQQPAAPVPAEPKTSPAAQKQAATAPEDSFAKAKDADVKRAATDKRRSERRQQWSEKRRAQQRQEQELREVEARVREETESGPIFAFEPVRTERPQIRLFDLD